LTPPASIGGTVGPVSDTARDAETDPKAVLHRYLRRQREQLLAKLDGLDDRQVRLPMTPTGTNLLGLIKHVASVDLGYFGEVFGRSHGEELPWFDPDAAVNADMWATADESREDIEALYRRAWEHADATIEALDLDSTGAVPWWPEDRRVVTLHQMLVHMTTETARHAGHADIVRELLDGRAGNDDGNLPDQHAAEWTAYVVQIQAAADTFGPPAEPG
jgi:uncharacterized damage-inducible protein DinB